MARTDVPETVVCPNCNHNVVIELYQVDISINSSQGHFHTVHHRREPAYTVYCINCGHFITNHPSGKPTRGHKASRPAASAQTAGKPRSAKTAPPKPKAPAPAGNGPGRTSSTRKKAK